MVAYLAMARGWRRRPSLGRATAATQPEIDVPLRRKSVATCLISARLMWNPPTPTSRSGRQPRREGPIAEVALPGQVDLAEREPGGEADLLSRSEVLGSVA
jgi:hypothetical protein